MSNLISLDFLLVKKIKNSQSLYDKFINKIYINNYEFFNIFKIWINNSKEIFAKDSYDKIIDKF